MQQKRSSLRHWSPFLAVTACLAAIFAAIALSYLQRYEVPPRAALGVYVAFLMLLVMAIAPALAPDWRPPVKTTRTQYAGLMYPLIWCSPYLVYASATGDFRWAALLKLVSLAAFPVAIYTLIPPRRTDRFSWQDATAAVVLAGVVLSGLVRGIWNVPTNLDFLSRLFLIVVGSWSWTLIRVVPELGYTLRITKQVLKHAAINFILYALIALPASMAMNFTRWNPRWAGVAPFLMDFLQIFLFIALLEELFFRGFLQTLISKSLGSWVAGQALVSVLFGLSHILHAPFPNWRYVALASVAGWFYGSAFRATGSIMSSSLLHAAVDTVWRTWLSAR